jgi:hypothetical protein
MNNNFIGSSGWIGTTHLDNYKITSNFILNTSNILESHLSNTSNILEGHLTNTSNILDSKASNFTTTTSNIILARYDKLIGEEKEHITLPFLTDLTHTYINNFNLAGEIRFFTESTSSYPVIIPIDIPDYRVKIGPNGHLMCYYTYDPAINLTFGNGWIDVGNSIVALNASDANIGVALGGLEIQIANNFQITQEQFKTLLLALQAQSILTDDNVNNINNFIEAQLDATRRGQQELGNVFYGIRNFYTSGQLSYLQIATNVITTRITNNPIISSIVGLGGIGFAAIASAIGNLSYAEHTLSQITSNINKMTGITETRRIELLEETKLEQIQAFIDYTCNIYNATIYQGFINSNIQTQQYIRDLRCDSLNLNNGNISGINYVNVNNIVADGRIKENNKFLDSTYLTSNHIYNLAYNYTDERQYPPKAYTTSTPETSVSLLNKLVYYQNLYLDTSSISYGSGFYEIYSSSTYDTNTPKSKLFNYITTDTINARFGINLYNSETGNYQGDNNIDGSYYGDWVIIKLPQPILLTKYRFYTGANTTSSPAEWKVYGSNDGITFTEIIDASQMTRLTFGDYTLTYYEKSFTITTTYNYIGFVFNKIIGLLQTELKFGEIRLFGKEILSNTVVSNIYTTSNVVKSLVRFEMNDVGKRKSFIIEIPSSSTFVDSTSSITFYKYDLDLTKYTRTQVIPSEPYTGDLIRIFRIKFWYVPSYFSSYINNEPYVNSYEVYMSNKSNAIFGRPETIGINIYTIGTPQNTKLSNILPNNLFLLKNYNSNNKIQTIKNKI